MEKILNREKKLDLQKVEFIIRYRFLNKENTLFAEMASFEKKTSFTIIYSVFNTRFPRKPDR